ncbi:MAG: hypothetical protein O7D30_04160 [Rickettsia endosymbiont of Ixodes persulcatus]|nr:hypothetical protein [Rickettsia endosymbiont of Ixodes persulcatus]
MNCSGLFRHKIWGNRAKGRLILPDVALSPVYNAPQARKKENDKPSELISRPVLPKSEKTEYPQSELLFKKIKKEMFYRKEFFYSQLYFRGCGAL